MVLPLAKLGNLGEYRESDKKASAEQLEVTEKQQTLNYRAVNSFLATNGFNKENFEKTFDLDAAIKLVEAEKEAEGAKKMAGVLNGAKANFVKYKSLDVLKNSDQEAARTRINDNVIEAKGALTDTAGMVEAYKTYRTIFQYGKGLLDLQQETQDRTDMEKQSVESSSKAEFASILEGVKKSYGKSSTGEKLIAGGAILVLGAMCFGDSDNPVVEGFKTTMWKALKLGGIGIGLNVLFKVLTGKSALDSVSDWSKKTVQSEAYWTKHFQTEPEKAEILRRGNIYFGQMDFLDLAERYQKAKSDCSYKIDLVNIDSSKMKPEEVYTSLDVFFHKYKPEVTKPKYQRFEHKPTFTEVLSTELIEGGSFKFDNGVIDSMSASVHNNFNDSKAWLLKNGPKAYEYVTSIDYAGKIRKAGKFGGKVIGATGGAVGMVAGSVVGGAGAGIVGGVYEGGKAAKDSFLDASGLSPERTVETAAAFWGWLKGLYLQAKGVDGTEQEIKDYAEELFKSLDTTKGENIDKFITERVDKRHVDGFKYAVRGKSGTDSINEVRYYEDAENIYASAEFHVTEPLKKGVDYSKVWMPTDERVRKFFAVRTKDTNPPVDVKHFSTFSCGVYVDSDATYRGLYRMPKPKSLEYNRRLVSQSPQEENHRETQDIFANEQIIYEKLSKADQEHLRLRFLLADYQTEELNWLCDYLTRNAAALGIDKMRAYQVVFESDELQKKVFDAMKHPVLKGGKSVIRVLDRNDVDMEEIEEDFSDVEEKIVNRIGGTAQMKETKLNQIKNGNGWKFRLAILGDHQAMLETNYQPGSIAKDALNTPEKLIAWYEKFLVKVLIEKKIT